MEADAAWNDCDDDDPWVFVGAREFCDGYDNDCDGLVDEGNETDAGGLDAKNGACAFRPARDEDEAADSGTASGSGCSTTGLGLSWWVTLGAGFLVRRPRRA